jgi:general secretion pathway protein F
MRGSIINALIYPAFLMVGVLGSLVLLLAYVVPQFVPIFADMQVPIPWITQAVLALGNTLQSWWWLIILLIGGMVRVARALRDPAARLAWHTRLLRCAGRSAAAESGNRAHRAHAGHAAEERRAAARRLTIARQVTSNRALDEALIQAHEQVKGGNGLSLALGQSKLFPRLAIQMVQVGEEAGQLDTMLLKVADTFELESKRAIDRLLAALVPRTDHRDDGDGGHHHGGDPAAAAQSDQQHPVICASDRRIPHARMKRRNQSMQYEDIHA